MDAWKLIPSLSGRTVYRRDLHDRFFVYVDYETDCQQESPHEYHWSIEYGSCGRVLEQGWVDGTEGVGGVQRIADEAVARMFSGSAT